MVSNGSLHLAILYKNLFISGESVGGDVASRQLLQYLTGTYSKSSWRKRLTTPLFVGFDIFNSNLTDKKNNLRFKSLVGLSSIFKLFRYPIIESSQFVGFLCE